MNISQAFVDDLARVINKHSVENDSNTPDFILAAFAANVIIAYGNAIKERKRWYAEDTGTSMMGAPVRAEDSEYLDVRAFHEKFNQLVGYEPLFITQRLARERYEFMKEELTEWWEKGVLKGNLNEIADGLIDLVYVAKGTAVMYGLPWRELWDDVQRANMAKVPKVTHRGTTHDVGKPDGWQAPYTEAILAHAGFNEQTAWYNVDYADSGEVAYQGKDGWVKVSNPPPEANSSGLGPDTDGGNNPSYQPENPIGGSER